MRNSLKPLCVFVFFVALLGYATASWGSMSCPQLTAYRDSQLVHDLDTQLKKHDLYAESIEYTKTLRSSLDGWFMSANWVRSDVSAVVAEAAAAIKLTCNLIGNTLAINPATGAVKAGAVQVTNVTSQRVFQYLQGGGVVKDMVEKGGEYAAFKASMSMAGPVGNSVKLVYELAEDTKLLIDIPKNHKSTKKDLDRAIGRLEGELKKAQQKLLRSDYRIEQINEIKNGIDMLCGKKPKSIEEELKELEQFEAQLNKDVDKAILNSDRVTLDERKSREVIAQLDDELASRRNQALNRAKNANQDMREALRRAAEERQREAQASREAPSDAWNTFFQVLTGVAVGYMDARMSTHKEKPRQTYRQQPTRVPTRVYRAPTRPPTEYQPRSRCPPGQHLCGNQCRGGPGGC